MGSELQGCVPQPHSNGKFVNVTVLAGWPDRHSDDGPDRREAWVRVVPG